MFDFLTNPEFLTGAGGVGAVAVILYKIKAILAEDRKEKDLDGKADKLISHYQQQTQDAVEHADRLQGRLEAVEKERNEFAQEVGHLRATVENLTDRIEDLNKTVESLEVENEKLREAMSEQKDMLEAMYHLQNALLEEIRGNFSQRSDI